MGPVVWPPPAHPEPEEDITRPAAATAMEGYASPPHPEPGGTPRRRGGCCSCLSWALAGIVGAVLALAGAAYLLAHVFPPGRTNILLLGMDRRPGESEVSRTDTMILSTVYPEADYVGMLSIPRDLYVDVPGVGANRINTAHFFAESNQPGTGPEAAVQTVSQNFGVTLHRYVRIDFEGFVRIVDAMGGMDIDVPHPLIDYEYPTHDYGTMIVEFQAGPQHLTGEQALAYARIRHGSSDFKRAERQQLVIQALVAQALKPDTLFRLPAVVDAVRSSVTTDLSAVELLRLSPTLLRASPFAWDRRVIQGEMVQPYTTPAGAAVQLPVWEKINPVLMEMFGE